MMTVAHGSRLGLQLARPLQVAADELGLVVRLILDLVVGLVVSLVLGLLLGGGARIGAGRTGRDSLSHFIFMFISFITIIIVAIIISNIIRRRAREIDTCRVHAGALHGLDSVDAAQGELQLRLHVRLVRVSGQWSVVSGQWSVVSGQGQGQG